MDESILNPSVHSGEIPMTTITLAEAQTDLPRLIDQLQPGEEMLIVDDGQPWAQVRKADRTPPPCQAGTAKDQILWIAPDFDSPLDEFREYME